ETLCGVLRNAYRPDQSVKICSLRDLLGMAFDMLTTIVIGNRFTRRKREWIFTPRGYNDWAADQVAGAASADVEIPSEGVWVFSGTSDGNALARELARNYRPIVVSTASEYGGDIVRERCPGVTVWAGRRGVEARRRALRGSGARAIVDATHPYAQVMSEQLIGLAEELAIPYLRYERPGVTDEQNVLWCESVGHAAERAIAVGKRIFLATGSKDLAAFLQAPGASAREWFVRVTPEPALIRRAIELGIPRDRILAMQGPFSEGFNHALWRDQHIDCVVTKDSGEAGGFSAKAHAAAALGIPLLVIRRPKVSYPRMAQDFATVGDILSGLGVRRPLGGVASRGDGLVGSMPP
ncbi:MAG TPA: precorrin-6A reductase, partial [Steroidobacteraceae bacterium]